ncbi:protein neprosin-like [Typha angustifolia]|uniref:protein neprosin-like n=1 Tax=Typha angustifolia TaxID=59011 RepID=UPI003C2C89D8
MANKRLMLLPFMWLSLVSFHQVNGRLLAENEDVESRTTLVKTKQRAGYQTLDGTYHGTTAKINVYDLPDVKGHQASYAAIYLRNIVDFVDNTIAAGVHVGGSVDCFNLECNPGFVLSNTSNSIPGAELVPTSVYDGEQRYITLTIKKDEYTGDWSLYRDDLGNQKLVGYWPKTLFTNLAQTATMVEWGGTVTFTKNETSPPMGSGHFPSEGERKAAHFERIELFDEEGKSYEPWEEDLSISTDKEDCYKASAFDDQMFYYGGPAGCN